jgi:aspartyl-tRNA(Asn)/glutamyl-tRNA(Gln) amidotransferase subunit B
MAYPGSMPFFNEQALVLAVRMGSALHCDIHSESSFDRKCYYYPDLPKAYQITQYHHPLMSGGYLQLENSRIRIKEAHMEEDSARIIRNPSTAQMSLDFNRAGISLLEIVTEADITEAEQASEVLKKVYSMAKELGVSSCKMEEGAFRCDVNISVAQENGIFYERVEIKNLNSFRFVEKAINYEKIRQMELVMQGGKIVRETRTYDEKMGTTLALRKKDGPGAYRYMPEPDLGIVRISRDEIQDFSRNEAP